MASPKTYSQEEVTEILRRAVELEARRRTPSKPAAPSDEDRPGLTIEEIVTIGTDAGLDLESLRRAVSEVGGPGRLVKSVDVTFNGPEIFVERWVRGKMDEHTADDMLEALREYEQTRQGALSGMPGNGMGTSSIHSGRRNTEWRHLGLGGSFETKVSLTPESGHVKIRVSLKSLAGGNWENMPGLNALFGGVGAVAAGLAFKLTGSWWLTGAAAMAGYAAASRLYQWYYRRSSVKYQEELRRLADFVVRQLADAMSAREEEAETTKTNGEAEQRPLLDGLNDAHGKIDADAVRLAKRSGLR